MAAAPKRHGPTYTEATLPPLKIVPLEQWERVRHREWRCSVPSHLLGYRAWLEIVDGYCVGANSDEEAKVDGWWLLWAERVDASYTVAVVSYMTRTCAVLISNRAGFVRRCARPLLEGMDPFREIIESGGDDAWVWRRLSAVRTAEAAVVVLREQRASRRRKGEAWLRRQLEGLWA